MRLMNSFHWVQYSAWYSYLFYLFCGSLFFRSKWTKPNNNCYKVIFYCRDIQMGDMISSYNQLNILITNDKKFIEINILQQSWSITIFFYSQPEFSLESVAKMDFVSKIKKTVFYYFYFQNTKCSFVPNRKALQKSSTTSTDLLITESSC